MEIIKILAVDPSLRNTGLAVLLFNTECATKNEKAFLVKDCQVVVNPQKFTGTEAILNMLDMLNEISMEGCYREVDHVLIESPAVIFNKNWPSSTMSSIAHISGGCVPIFGIDKAHLFRPNEWNRSRKKEVTHAKTIAMLGNPDTWGYKKRVKSEKFMEHILDAVSMALWWVQANYLEE